MLAHALVISDSLLGLAVEARKREGVPTATVFPCHSDLETDLFEKAPNALVCDDSNEVQWSTCSSPSAVLEALNAALRVN